MKQLKSLNVKFFWKKSENIHGTIKQRNNLNKLQYIENFISAEACTYVAESFFFPFIFW